jgi:hypothetical protein
MISLSSAAGSRDATTRDMGQTLSVAGQMAVLADYYASPLNALIIDAGAFCKPWFQKQKCKSSS